MKNVYIHGSDGGIQWVEDDENDELQSSSVEWSSDVRFKQHSDSEEDVFFNASGGATEFAVGSGSGDSLRTKPVEMSPSSDQRVYFKADDDSSQQGGGGGKRWFSGYTQSK